MITLNKCKVKQTGLILDDNLSFEEWSNIGTQLQVMHGSIGFWIGDWLNFGEQKYGEKYAQAIEETGVDIGTLQNYNWVASRVESSRRRENVSFGCHQCVAPLEPKQQDELLEKADKEHLTVQELRVYIKELKLDELQNDIDDRKITPYGDNMFYLSTKWQDSRDDSYKIIDGDTYPTLKRRSWFYHPDGREFSLREYANVQDFPKTFKFVGTYESIKDQIGNAVSPKMAQFVSKSLKGKTIGDIFAGCGGFSCGMELDGKKSLWAIERNIKYARTYAINHPSSKVLTRDIKKVDPNKLEKVDIIIGGPPCQGFSLSGMRFKDDPRNELYKEFVRFVKEIKPKEFVLENVPQIQIYKDQITKDFDKVGYKVKSYLIKGEEIGMKQKRHRYFFQGELWE